jgi:hypothetical protein
MDRTTTIPRSRLVSVCRDGLGHRPWKPHKMHRTVTGEVIAGRSGAIVVRFEGWLILTRESEEK